MTGEAAPVAPSSSVRPGLAQHIGRDACALRIVDRTSDGRDVLFAIDAELFVVAHVLTAMEDEVRLAGLVGAWPRRSTSLTPPSNVQLDYTGRARAARDRPGAPVNAG
jgi:hypothetical protein